MWIQYRWTALRGVHCRLNRHRVVAWIRIGLGRADTRAIGQGARRLWRDDDADNRLGAAGHRTEITGNGDRAAA